MGGVISEADGAGGAELHRAGLTATGTVILEGLGGPPPLPPAMAVGVVPVIVLVLLLVILA